MIEMDCPANSEADCVLDTKTVNTDETISAPESEAESQLSSNDNNQECSAGETTNEESPASIGPDDDATFDITPEKSGGVLKKILKEGEGEDLPGYGDRVAVHYTGWLLSKELVVFDSNVEEERFEFSLGRGMVIKGWDLGISTMKKGEVALFICHPKYAYGEMGYPPAIPPRTPLLFQIKLFEWKLDDLSPKKDESILRKVLVKGEGNAAPNEGSQVKVEIIQYTDDGGETKEEKDFILGEGCIAGVHEGLEIALQKFGLKEKSLIYLKNKYAEDVNRISDADVTSAEVKYELTLVHFEKAKNIWEMNSDEKFEKAKLSKEKGINFYKMGHYKLALKQFKWIVTCLENEPGVSPESQEPRKELLLSGYLNIALSHQKLGNHMDVVKTCTKALALDPNSEKALFRRGQAKVEINDCEEALSDFETLCSLNPDNKAAQNYVTVCQQNIKKQQQKDKSTYNKMFEIFVKQDEERLKNMKTETGVWENEKGEDQADCCSDQEDSLLKENNSVLLDANVIEISNTANGNISYDM